MHRNAPFRFAAITASKASSGMVIMSPSRVMPALFTRMSSRPKRFTTAATMSLTASASVTSQRRARVSAPRARQASSVSRAAASFPA